MDEQSKDRDLAPFREDPTGTALNTDQGVRIPDTDNSLRAGPRGPSLLEDFHLREKITHFDHERIPERVVHARGNAAHGYFQPYESMAEYTTAAFLQDPAVKTPVFVRFSTVGGSRGSADTARDVRGFATRFYTSEGNFDLVGNNIPVFFIQDGIKFPDLVHAVKPEPDNEIPQASTAHDTFWDFASLLPESAHMLMWLLSDRAIPRSQRMMEGFGVHTFRLVNAAGKARFVKWHWKPKLGVHSLVWEEAQLLAGKDPDYHRRDLWDAIARGDFPEWELGVQIIEEGDEHKFAFDLLDATKLVPEALVPVRRIGRMVLNRNPDNFFAETEQVAFHVGNVVPGIDVTNDPLLQARLFSYLDTQLTRLGGPNFSEIPINRPLVPVHNNNQDGFMQQKVKAGKVNYTPNSLGGGCPFTMHGAGAYVPYLEKVDSAKVRQRAESFADHFSQAKLFYDSLSAVEQRHLVKAARFELGKVQILAVRQRVVALFRHIDEGLAQAVAAGIGVHLLAPGSEGSDLGEAVRKTVEAVKERLHGRQSVDRDPALSQDQTVKDTAASRLVAALLAPGFRHADLLAVQDALRAAGAHLVVVSTQLGAVPSAEGTAVEAAQSLLTSASVLFDAVYVPGGAASVAALSQEGDALRFVSEAFRHCKAIGATAEGTELLRAAGLGALALPDPATSLPVSAERGIVTAPGPDLRAFAAEFLRAIAQHRHWVREALAQRVP